MAALQESYATAQGHVNQQTLAPALLTGQTAAQAQIRKMKLIVMVMSVDNAFIIVGPQAITGIAFGVIFIYILIVMILLLILYILMERMFIKHIMLARLLLMVTGSANGDQVLHNMAVHVALLLIIIIMYALCHNSLMASGALENHKQIPYLNNPSLEIPTF
jgi:hypothetical protein